MKIRQGVEGFGPVADSNSKALILGSYPSPKSFESGFYYGHPQNRFWKLIATLAAISKGKQPQNARVPTTVEEKTALLLASHLAIWDSLKTCTITGAQDTSIRDAHPNDISGLLNSTSISAVFCNGAASFKYYQKYCLPLTGIPAALLPSTSPANAAYSLEKLTDAWSPLLEYMG